MKTHPFTGKRYSKSFFDARMVESLLLLVAVDIEAGVVARWTPDQLQQAGDWALRTHLRASDNTNRVPPRPEFVPDFRPLNAGARTVMDL